MRELERRTQHAVESILGNESLTADLDDPAAQALLDWGITCAERIAGRTAGLNDEQAEEIIYPGMRATRRLMRLVQRWASHQTGMDTALLDQILEQAAIIYPDFTPPSTHRRVMFLYQIPDSPLQRIAQIREFVQGPSDTASTPPGGNDDQEEI